MLANCFSSYPGPEPSGGYEEAGISVFISDFLSLCPAHHAAVALESRGHSRLSRASGFTYRPERCF